MLSKRKSASLGLGRRVRARREDDWEPEPDLSDQSEEEEASEEGEDIGDDSDEDGFGSDSAGESDASDEDAGPKADFSSVSFGALARAQASLPPTERKRKAIKDSELEPTLRKDFSRNEAKPSLESKELAKRASKHAPQEITSKKPVSRRREIIADTRRKARDPRFDPLIGNVDEAKLAKAYSFLDDYRESEIADLRAQIKKTKDAGQREDLKRQLLSMESKKKARQKKEEEARILDEHRKKEKELVAQGKKPFYLKQSEQKKQLLVNRYASMSKGQVDRAIERKRKKVASKEKKELASLERVQRRH